MLRVTFILVSYRFGHLFLCVGRCDLLQRGRVDWARTTLQDGIDHDWNRHA
jgi:hypothetical protein